MASPQAKEKGWACGAVYETAPKREIVMKVLASDLKALNIRRTQWIPLRSENRTQWGALYDVVVASQKPIGKFHCLDIQFDLQASEIYVDAIKTKFTRWSINAGDLGLELQSANPEEKYVVQEIFPSTSASNSPKLITFVAFKYYLTWRSEWNLAGYQFLKWNRERNEVEESSKYVDFSKIGNLIARLESVDPVLGKIEISLATSVSGKNSTANIGNDHFSFADYLSDSDLMIFRTVFKCTNDYVLSQEKGNFLVEPISSTKRKCFLLGEEFDINSPKQLR